MLYLSEPHISEEAISAVIESLQSGKLVHGPESEAFEKELASYLGCTDVVLVSSGTAALHIALLSLNIGHGDAVIVPDFTFPATGNVVLMTGAKPVIVDVEPRTYNMDPAALETIIKGWQGPERLCAVMPVLEFGSPANMDEISTIAEGNGLTVIEDAACALGADCNEKKAGTVGKVGCFSFHPRKTLTTGEGGAIAVHDSQIAGRMRRMRNHGMERIGNGVQFVEPTTNYRLTNFQAALGRVQLRHLDDWISARRALAGYYLDQLAPLEKKKLLK